MIVSSYRGKICLLLVLAFVAGLVGSCVKVDIDEEPPYPLKERDYSYPTPEEKQPPWENPEDYPYVTITAPANGEFVDAGEIAVIGTYAGPALDSLTINGRAVNVSSGNFNATVTVSDAALDFPIAATATTEDGLVSSDRVTVFRGAAAAADSPVPYAILIDLENRGMDNVGKLLSGALDGMDITDLLNNLINPALRAQFADTVVINEALIKNVDVSLAAQEDGLEVNALASVAINITLFGIYTLDIELNGVTLEMVANLTVDTGNTLVFEVVSSSFAIADVQLNGPLIPGFIGDLVSLLSSTLWDLFLQNLLVDELNTLLGGLNIALNIDGATFTLLPSATLFTAHDFALAFDTTTTLAEGWTPAIQPDGFLTTPSTPPTFTENTPVNNSPYGLAVALNDDTLNQLLYLLAASGGLNFQVQDPILDAEILSIIFWSFESIDPDMPVILQFSPTVAPIVVGGDEGPMELRLTGYTGSLMVDRGDDGLWEALSFAIDLTAATSLLAVSEDTIGLDLGELGISMSVVHNPVGQVNIPNIDRLLAELFDSVLPDLLESLGSLQFTIPEIANLQIGIPEISAIGPNYDYLGLFVDLVY